MKHAAMVFLVTVMALIAAACGAPDPTASPWTLSPQEAAAIDDNINSVIDIARTRMAALRTAHFSIDVESASPLKLEFDVRFPYEVQGVMTGSGDPEEVGLLLTKGKAFTGDPKGSCWTEMTIPIGIVFVYGANVVSPILQARLDLVDSIRNLEHTPDGTAEAFYHFRFELDWPLWFTLWVQGLDQATGEETANEMYPPESREAILSSGLQGAVYKGEAWIDKETLLVHRFLWKQVSTVTGLADYTWTLTLSHFDQAVPEVPEVEPIRAVGPCTEDRRPGSTMTPTPTPTASPPPAATGGLGHIAFRSYVDGNADIYVVNDDGSNQTRLTDGQAFVDMPRWSPDGSKIAFVSQTPEQSSDAIWEIYVMDADGSNQTRITHSSTHKEAPVWSPDGSKIVFTSRRDGNSDIYVINADGSNEVRTTTNTGSDSNPTWSPDGSKIAFVSSREGLGGIYVMDADGSNQTRLAAGSVFHRELDWSPDGSKIAFVSSRDRTQQIYVMDADGSNQTRLTDDPDNRRMPIWSPNGSKIAFVSSINSIPYLYVMDSDGSNQTRLATVGVIGKQLDWSPDGRKIAFRSGSGGEIFVMDADGSNPTQLTNIPGLSLTCCPAWSPAR